jgi:hypothetical protein
LQSPERIIYLNIVMRKGYFEISLISCSRLGGPIRVFINRNDSGHLKIIKDFVSDLELNNAVEKESSFNFNEKIEEFLSYKVQSWSFFSKYKISKYKIFKEVFSNILGEEFVGTFVEVVS